MTQCPDTTKAGEPDDRASIALGLRENGYAFLPEWECNLATRAVASKFGHVIDIESILPGSGIPTVQRLTPRRQSNAPKTHYSGNFGFGAFPLHSDLAHWAWPPRYFVLRCINGAPDIATTILHIEAVSDAVGEAKVRRGLTKPRRASSYGTASLLPVAIHSKDTVGMRWDSLFLKPMNAAAEDIKEFMLREASHSSQVRRVFLHRSGDTLIIDNWKVLHGRSSAPENADRIIERIYLSEVTI